MMGKSNINADSQADMDSWEFHLTYVAKTDSLKDEEKTQVLDGLAKLKQVFDDNWLRQARKEHHPIVMYVLNKAPWSQLWLADFGTKLDALKQIATPQSFDRLAGRLRSSTQYAGAEAEVEAITKLIAAGITDLELYPKVEVKGKPKEPELRAVVHGEDVYFEVTALREPQDSLDAWRTHQELTLSLFDHETLHELLYFCQIHKILSPPRIEEFKAKIKKAIAEVKRSKQFAYIGEPGVLDYLVIHRSNHEQCDALVKRFGMKQETSGPPFETDDIRRLRHKLRKKHRQLPEDKPGVIVVFCNLLYFGSAEHFYADLVYQVEETIYERDNIVLAAIINKTGELGLVSEVDQRPHYTLVRKSHNLVQESIVVLKNRYSKFAINQKIVSALTS